MDKLDTLKISYSKLNDNSCLLVAKITNTGGIVVINEYMNEQADKVYAILCGHKDAIKEGE